MQNPRKVKQITLAIIYVVLFGLIGWYLYYLISPDPTCTDGKKNQSEKGVDCGGPCKPCQNAQAAKDIEVVEKTFVDGGGGTYDVLLKVSNPNYILGSDTISYTITLKDSAGAEVGKKTGTSYILPADSRYIIEMGIVPDVSGVSVASVDVSFDKITWKELPNMSKPQLNIYNRRFGEAPMGAGNIAEAVVRNESPYDLNTVQIAIIIRDEYGKVVGLNTSLKQSLRAREEQSFRVTWPYQFKGNARKLEIEAQSNMYDAGNLSSTPDARQ